MDDMVILLKYADMQVAEICLAALYEPGASNKIVEVGWSWHAPP